MSALPDYYEVMGVSPTSDDVVIRAAFKALMLKYHPDTNKGDDATKRAAAINAAWAVLGNPEQRARYDSQRAAGSAKAGTSSGDGRKAGASAPPPPPPPKQPTSPADKNEANSIPKGRSKPSRSIGPAAVIIVLALGGVWAAAVNHKISETRVASPVENAAENASVAMDLNAAVSDAVSNSAAEAFSTSTTDSQSNLFGSGLGRPIVTPNPATATVDPVSYDNIEAAADKFDRVLQKSGMIGARTYSEACHKAVAAAPTWSSADGCAAFDYAASFVDEGVSKSMNAIPFGYFTFQKENQSDNYRAFGSYLPDLRNRLDTIQRTAIRAVYDDIQMRTATSDAPKNDNSAVANQAGNAQP